jgi:DNA helicase-2/ATP-dependent DNA helicase PcrA
MMPGTGKTTYLVQRSLERHGTVTFCSHTRTAAQAATSSAQYQELKKTGIDWKASTIHSLCFRALGLSRAQVVSDHNLESFCKRTGFILEADEEKPSELRTYFHVNSFARTVGITDDAAFEAYGAVGSRTDFRRFVHAYREWKDAFGFVDYTDMLTMTVERGFVARLGSLVIDEAQDLTPLHWAVVERMLEVCDDVTVAGDDDQAIFQWTGADPHGMARFAEKHDSEVKVLSQSYRVPSAVHSLAQAIASKMSARQHKEYRPRPAEGRVASGVALDKPMLRDLYRGNSMMILFRNKYSRAKYVRLLTEELVPFVTDVGNSPLQKRSGQAFHRLRQEKWFEAVDIRVIRSGLTQYGLQLADTVGYGAVAEMLDGEKATDVINTNHAEISYLQRVSLDARRVDLRTIHSAKGMEADSVVVVSSMTKSTIESFYKDQDAEHRVMYVGVTRAKTNLFLVHDTNGYLFPRAA